MEITEFLRHLIGGRCQVLDIRAEVEFAAGHLPASCNIPILSDQERHAVGTCYKQEGQSAAIALGQSLTAPYKEVRINAWKAFLAPQSFPLLTCWRGGLRSRIAQEWLATAGFEVTRLRGGYKAARATLLNTLDQPHYSGAVLMGYTGAGKTKFLEQMPKAPLRALDLEALANHRGSAFGNKGLQPSLQSFENCLALELLQADAENSFCVTEDESRHLGKIYLRNHFWAYHRSLPALFLDIDIENRIQNIYEDYVSSHHDIEILGSLHSIRNRLGGLLHSQIEGQIQIAFRSKSYEAHAAWIRSLLQNYYDRLYDYSLSRSGRKPIFRGSAADVLEKLHELANC